MATVTTLGSWDAFFGAVVAAAAALAGLLFVAVSINVEQILRYPSLPTLAAETLALLVGTLITAGVALVPTGATTARGAVLLVVTGVTWVISAILQARTHLGRGRDEHAVIPVRVATSQIPALLMLVGAALTTAGSGAGLDVLAGGMLAAFAGVAVNAWILLVEILR